MRLTRLELSGFKSFAKTTVLEFPSRITAVVGPNGSGKSNIKDAMQWVLGEQSMKSLRGKKGEDLIWNGSALLATSGSAGSRQGGVPRMGKASVTLVFDNADRQIPIEFDELILSRKIFRDGMNEYAINNSVVRMRDVIMLTAQMGLGESKHNIIGQGEVDRILMASGRERRGMLEEALGLRVYQLKKNETERKLGATEENMKQAESLIRELAPHLKFLRLQAEKAEARERTEAELRNFQKAYWAAELRAIAEDKARVNAQADPIRHREEGINVEIIRLNARLAELEKPARMTVQSGGSAADSDQTGKERKTAELAGRRAELERELGRLEGRLEAERDRGQSRITADTHQHDTRPVDVSYVRERIMHYIHEMRQLFFAYDDIAQMRARGSALIGRLEKLAMELDSRRDVGVESEAVGAHHVHRISPDDADAHQKGNAIPESPLVRELEGARAVIQQEIGRISKEIEQHEQARRKEYEAFREAQSRIREIEGLLRLKQEEQRDVMLEAERFRFDEERLHAREQELNAELASVHVSSDEILAEVSGQEYASLRPEDIKRRIERLSGKLEEIGGIDPSVVIEYKEAEARHLFLTKELDDVRHAASSLRELIKELDEHMRRDFYEGFAKINREFHAYFGIIFGGGKAELKITKHEAHNKEQDEDGESEEKEENEEGIEIQVDLPRKRIKSLAMLSGGERALTSIALLFAIAAVNPPPFLILDETDAALDEANSQRYGAILAELAKHTQLIVITHNRETMKSAGVLYGITMGDDGVSKLLSLKLEEAETYTNR
ncbi:MAG: AAA family ATPase [Candidatus Sungbacteria bacterium]|nr:AAA family ATPase [Candidatus Sungbacteria bacterium]